jgi:transcriptional regulator with XRE-family HTH domain
VIHLFGDKLRELRKEKKVSQEEIGKLCGVAKNTVSNWENNINKPDIDLVLKLAQYFNVTTDYLLGFTQDDLDKIKQLEIALKNAGVDNIEQAMQIIDILKNEKDTKK